MSRKQSENAVKLSAENLAIGDSRKITCPECGGGASKETSCSITREALGVLYVCFRAKCGFRGFTGTAAAALPPKAKQQKLRPYTRPVLPLEPVDEQYFYTRFEIHRTKEIFLSEKGEYILPVYSARGSIRGHTVRQPVWKGEPAAPREGNPNPNYPKAVAYPCVPEAQQSVYRASGMVREARQSRLVVVEDQISAIAAAQAGYTSVALCGTEVCSDKVREWSLLRPSEVLIALDADATALGFKIARKWGLAFERVRVIILDKDLKDSHQEDFDEILGVEI